MRKQSPKPTIAVNSSIDLSATRTHGLELHPDILGSLRRDPEAAAQMLERLFDQLSPEVQDRFIKAKLSQLLSSEKAAKVLGVSHVRVKQLALRGKLGLKVGRDYVFTQQEIAVRAEKKEVGES